MDELFKNISDAEKNILLQSLEANIMNFKKNNIILSSIKDQNFICILVYGHLQIIKNDYNGNKTIIEDLYENDLFGTMISSITTNLECDFYTKEDSKILLIDFDDVINNKSNLQCFNQFLKNMLLIISNKILENNKRIEILTNKTIRDKLLSYFKYNVKNKKIHLTLSYTDLADYLAVNRSAMSRELKNLKNEGFIEVKGKTIYLLYDIL